MNEVVTTVLVAMTNVAFFSGTTVAVYAHSSWVWSALAWCARLEIEHPLPSPASSPSYKLPYQSPYAPFDDPARLEVYNNELDKEVEDDDDMTD